MTAATPGPARTTRPAPTGPQRTDGVPLLRAGRHGRRGGAFRLHPTSAIYRGQVLGADSLRQLVESGAVGDSCCHFVDAESRLVVGFEERTSGISAEQVRRVPMRMALAYGRRKLLAIHAALRTGLVNAFATDDDTAAALLALDTHAGQ